VYVNRAKGKASTVPRHRDINEFLARKICRAGWDHDHCDACGVSIKTNVECWTTRGADFRLICDACFNQLK